ncbi:MAG: hypothetical protein HY744_27200, partial [Deltaproteobacteria bacterium]|nr:hypothetical protein [Deltaproteobacteria bacterium]
MADVKAGKLVVTSAPGSIGPLQQAMAAFLETTQGYNALLQIHYQGAPLLLGCAQYLGDACLTEVHYNPYQQPHFIPELVQDTPWQTVPSFLVSNLGTSLGDLSDIDAFSPPNGMLEIWSAGDPRIEIQLARGWVGKEFVAKDVAGLFFPFDVEFEGTTADLYCACSNLLGTEITASHPIIADTCNALVNLGFCLPVGGLPPAEDRCLIANVHVRVNRVPFSIGLVPALPAPAGSGSWTSSLFPGAKDFHVQDMFRVRPVVATPLSVFTTVEDNAAVDANVSDSIALSADVSCGINSGIACDLVGVALGYDSCDELAAAEAKRNLIERVGSKLATSVLKQLDPLLTYGNDSEPGKLGACNWPDNPAQPAEGECGHGSTLRDDLFWRAAASATYQKWSWFASPFGPYVNGGWLPITNISSESLGGSLAKITFEFDNDVDGDGLLTPEDPCPLLPKVDLWGVWSHLDDDGDNVGNGCDPCPFDSDNDADGDGLCADKDNCHNRSNPDQYNSNAVSEQAHKAPAWGDACDPVPCPAQRTLLEWANLKITNCPQCSKEDWLGGVCPPGCPVSVPGISVQVVCSTAYADHIAVRPLASHPSPVQLGTVEPVPVPGKVATPARFCQKSLNVTCTSPFDIQDERLEDSLCVAPKSCADPETKYDRFHRISFGYVSDGQSGHDPNDPPPELKYERDSQIDQKGADFLIWDWEPDFNRWSKYDLFREPLASAQELKGNLWLHAETKVGDGDLSLGTGFHGDLLANSHNLGPSGTGLRPAPGETCFTLTSKTLPGLGDLPETAPPFPPQQLGSAKSIVWQPSPSPEEGDFLLFGSQPGEASQIVHLQPQGYGALTGSEQWAYELVDDKLGAELLAAVKSPGPVWVNAAEPFAQQGAGPTFPGTVALSEDGSQLLMSVTSDGAGLQGDGDRPLCPEVVGLEPPPTFLGSFFGYGPELGQWEHPFAVAVDDAPQGQVFVSDTHAVRICRLEADGTGPLCWGSQCNLYDGYIGFPPGYGCVDPDGDGPLELGDGQLAKYAHGPDEWALAFDPVA